eukprot:1160504-Pelagomonas_calceolata.AAC.1
MSSTWHSRKLPTCAASQLQRPQHGTAILLGCQCVRSLPLPSMSGRVLAQHTNAFPGYIA